MPPDSIVKQFNIFKDAIGGVAAGGVASGNLKGAVKGSVMAAVTFGIGHGFDGAGGIGEPGSVSRMFAHSMVGGVSAEVDGGQFGHGFLSSMVSQSVGTKGVFQSKNIVTSVVSNAILQGSISELTGGKFANGAITGAFRTAFNHAILVGNQTVTNYKPGRFVCQSNCQWKSEVDAQKAAAKAYYDLSVKDGKEYGWHVYEHSDGTFTYPSVGKKTSVNQEGVWTSKTGIYTNLSSGHTHLDHSQFSGQDINYVTQGTRSPYDDRPLFLAAPDKNLYYLSSKSAIRNSAFASGSKTHFRSKHVTNHLPTNQAENHGSF